MMSKVDKMHGQTHLLKRGSKYYFRVRIPDDLRGLYDGKWEFKISLRTSDKREAIRQCNLKSFEFGEAFAQKRQQRSVALGLSPRRKITQVTPSFVEELKARWIREVLVNDQARRTAGLDHDEFEEIQAQTNQTQTALKDALARGDTKAIAPALNLLIHLLGIELDVSEEGYRTLAYGYLQAAAKANELVQKRNLGEVVDTDAVVTEETALPVSAAHVEQSGLMDLFDYWAAAAPRKDKTRDAYKVTVDAFIALIGNKPAAELRKADFVAFKDHLQASGLNYKTVTNQLVNLKAILNLAVENDKLEANPGASVRVVKPKVKEISRLPFDASDLKKIFGCALYLSGDRPRAGGGEAAVWLPLLGLFTGGRLEELGQLQVADITRDATAGHFMTITDTGAGDKSVKTEASRRRVPIHPALVQAGFISYRNAMARSDNTQLFPDLKPDRYGTLTGNFSKWFGRYLRQEIGISDRKKVFHSLRHSFKDQCREAGISEDIHDALTGHTSGSVGRKYGIGHTLKTLADAVASISYPGLKIPAVPVSVATEKGRAGMKHIISRARAKESKRVAKPTTPRRS